MPSCSIRQCSARKTKNQPQLSIHRFPKRKVNRQKWIDAIGIENINLRHNNLYVCSLHFEESQFNRTLNMLRLRDDAVPSLFLMVNSREIHSTKANRELGIIAETKNRWCPHVTSRKHKLQSSTIQCPNCPCLSDHGYTKDKVHNDHSYVKIGVSGMQGTKTSNILGTDEDGGTVCYEVPVADGVHDALEDAAKDSPDIAAEAAPEDAAEDPDTPDPVSGESTMAVFSWEAETDLIDDTDVLPHQDVSAHAVLHQDLTETSLYQDDDPIGSRDHSGYDHSYGCNECGGRIVGFRYTCVQCEDWDLCAACEARAAHAAHYLLRIPNQRPYEEIQAVLATIRQNLLSEHHLKQERADSVKSEPEEPQESLESLESQEPQESPPAKTPPEADGDPLGGWNVEFIDSSDIVSVPEPSELAPPPKRARRTTPPYRSDSILRRLLRFRRPNIDKTSEAPPIRSRSEDKVDPHRTDTSEARRPAPIPNIEIAKNIFVRIPEGFDPDGVVKMLNPQVSVRLKPIEESSAKVVRKKTDN